MIATDDGFTGNSQECVDINECDNGSDACSENAFCANNVGICNRM